MADKIKVEDLWDEEIPEVEAVRAKAWLEEQHRCLEAVSKLPGGPLNYWDPEDGYNSELEYESNTVHTKPNLSHLKVDKDGKIDVNSLPD